jgi:hypothetical protein
MTDDMPWYVSLSLSWLPFLTLLGLGIWMTLTIRAALRTSDGRSIAQAVDDLAVELRRSNDLAAQALKGERRGPDAGKPKV